MSHRAQRQPAVRVFRPAPLCLALAAAFTLAPSLAQPLPTGAVAVHGTTTVTQPKPSQLLVTTTNGAGTRHSVTDWQSFSIGAGNSVSILQPNALSTSINRVVTNTPSQLFGSLSSNGQVVLVNQSGITVGSGAYIDTAGFTASTLGMSDADAIAGRLRFKNNSKLSNEHEGNRPLLIEGNIIARGGDVVLIAPSIELAQTAVVEAQGGTVMLAAGQSVDITGRGLEGITLHVQAPADQALNLGTLKGDAVGIFAGTLRHSGLIQANAVSTEGGRVVLKAQDKAEVAGQVQALGTNATDGKGGQIHITGRTVVLAEGAEVDASGTRGGGEVLIGGGWHGADTRLSNARRTVLAAGASVKADALTRGNGGQVVIWSDEATGFAGTISAQGGTLGGNGGQVEVSGKQYLGFGGMVDLRAARGDKGSLLLDPLNLTIGNVAAVDGSTGNVTGNILNTDFAGANSQITAAQVSSLLNVGNLSLAATNNITVANAINKASGSASTLTLDAGNDINVNAAITNPGGGALSLAMTAGNAIATTADITTFGGMVNMTATNGGINLGGNIDAGIGPVMLNAHTGITQNTGVIYGVSLIAGSSLGAMTLNGANNVSLARLSTGTGSVSFNNLASSYNLGGSGGGNLTVTGTGAVNVDQATAFTNISIASAAGITLTADLLANGALSLTTTNANITQTSGKVTSFSATVNAGTGDISLPTATNDNLSIGLTGGNIFVRDANDLSISALNQISNRNLTLHAGGNLTLPSATVNAVTGNVNVISDTGSIASSTFFSSGNAISFSAATGITLDASVISSGAMNFTTTGTGSLMTVHQNATSGGLMTLNLAGDLLVSALVNNAGLQSLGGQSITAQNVNLLGTSAGSAFITNSTGGNQVISVASLTLDAGDTGNSHAVFINQNRAAGTQTIVASGDITLSGGGGGTSNTAVIESAGNQSITANGIVVGGGSGGGGVGVGNFASIISNASQTIVVGSGGITLTGGGGFTDNGAAIHQFGLAGTSQSITVNGGGDIVLQGGSSSMTNVGSTHGSKAEIHAAGSAQTISFTAGGNISVTGGTAGSAADAGIYSNNGSQTITGVHDITVAGGASGGVIGEDNSAFISADSGVQTISATGLILLRGGASGIDNSAALFGETGQSVTANGITLEGGNGLGGLDHGNVAFIATNGSQSVTVDIGGISLTGGGGSQTDNTASIYQIGTSGTQTITVNGGGSINLQGGSSAGSNLGGNHGSVAVIQSDGVSQLISFTAGEGDLSLTGGSVGSRNLASVYASHGNQTITGVSNIHLQGGASGGVAGEGNFANIAANAGTQSIAATGLIELVGGGAGTSNFAALFSAGNQSVSASGIHLTGGAGGGGLGSGNSATLSTSASQTITVGSGGLHLTGGGGSLTDNAAMVLQSGLAGTTQLITVNNGGIVSLQGGSSAMQSVGSGHGSRALIEADGGSQTINFTSGGAISLTGGTVGSRNFAQIYSANGSQTIIGSPDITMAGGASGGITGEGNFASISAQLGAQSITAGAVALEGGAAGFDNSAAITAAQQSLVFNGDLSLLGGGGDSNSGARIGGRSNSNTNLNLSVAGDISMGAGSGNGVAIGASNSATGFNSVVVVSATGDITMSPVGAQGTRIGASSAAPQTGSVSVTAGGSLTLNDGGGAGLAAIRSIGDVTLTALDLSLDGVVSGAHLALTGSHAVSLGSHAALSATATSGDTLVLRSGMGGFTYGGSGAPLTVAAGGRWLVYSVNTENDSRGSLAYNFKQFGKAFGDSTAILGSGNGFLYSAVPLFTVALTGTTTHVYDGTTTTSLAGSGYTATGVDGDLLTLTAPTTGTLDSKNVGSGKTVTAAFTFSSGQEASGAAVYGYTPGAITGTGSVGTVTERTVSVASGILASDKVYDGNTSVTLSSGGTLLGVVGADNVLVGGATGAFSDKNAGVSKVVNISGLTLSGNDAANYVLASSSTTTTATITPLALTGVSGLTASNKTYNGNTAATVVATGLSYAGMVSGDVLTLANASGSFADKNVGTGKTVTLGNFVLGGADALNYTTTGLTTTTTANITPATITAVTGITASKVYDGNSSATALLGGASFTGGVAGDNLTVASALASFTDRHVGTGKVLNVSGITLGGSDAGNYTLSGAASSAVSTGTITQLGSVTWTGSGGDGQWATASNWAGNALPDAANVAGVVIPAGMGTISLTSALAPTTLQSITSGSPVVQTSGTLISSGLSINTSAGINLLSGTNAISALSGSNTGSGNIDIVNNVPIVVNVLSNTSGDIHLVNRGGVSLVGPVTASAGGVDVTANSPLTVGAGGVSASGNVSLTATNLTSAGNLTLDGPVSSSGGAVNLSAANNLVQNSAVFGANGVTASAGGTMTFGLLATSNNSPVSYTAGGVSVTPPPKEVFIPGTQSDLTATFLDKFEAALDEQQVAQADTNPDGSRKKRDVDAIVTEGEMCRP